MNNINKNILFHKSHSSSENKLGKEVPQSIFRQELVTWSYTENGVKKTKLIRNFTKEKHIDSFISEPIIFGKDVK